DFFIMHDKHCVGCNHFIGNMSTAVVKVSGSGRTLKRCRSVAFSWRTQEPLSLGCLLNILYQRATLSLLTALMFSAPMCSCFLKELHTILTQTSSISICILCSMFQ